MVQVSLLKHGGWRGLHKQRLDAKECKRTRNDLQARMSRDRIVFPILSQHPIPSSWPSHSIPLVSIVGSPRSRCAALVRQSSTLDGRCRDERSARTGTSCMEDPEPPSPLQVHQHTPCTAINSTRTLPPAGTKNPPRFRPRHPHREGGAGDGRYRPQN